jgi:hypothetical protein
MSTLGLGALAPGRFRLLLLMLLLFIVGTAAAPRTGHDQLAEFVLLVVTIVVALVELRAAGQRWPASVVLASSVILVTLVNLTVRFRHVPVIASLVVTLFAGLVVWLVYSSVMRRERPVGDRIVGAISVYLLIGLAWASVFEAIDTVAPGSFRFPAEGAWDAPGPQRYRYFSFVTLATLGYGDITPASVISGTLAALEAVSGQLYIGITVARLVALSMGEHTGIGDRPK